MYDSSDSDPDLDSSEEEDEDEEEEEEDNSSDEGYGVQRSKPPSSHPLAQHLFGSKPKEVRICKYNIYNTVG